MKPSWDDAPEWANWLAQDEDGSWWWYGAKPEWNPDGFWWAGRSETVLFLRASNKPFFPEAESTLEARP